MKPFTIIAIIIVITVIGSAVTLQHKQLEQERRTLSYYFELCIDKANEEGLVKGYEIIAAYNCSLIASNICTMRGCRE